MAKLTAKQASDLANDFLGLAQAIGDFRYSHWHTLSAEENRQLSKMQWSVLNYGEDISALSTTLVLNDAAATLAEMDSITVQIRQRISELDKVQKAINLAAIIVALGGAIISKRPQAVLDHLQELSDTWNEE